MASEVVSRGVEGEGAVCAFIQANTAVWSAAWNLHRENLRPPSPDDPRNQPQPRARFSPAEHRLGGLGAGQGQRLGLGTRPSWTESRLG